MLKLDFISIVVALIAASITTAAIGWYAGKPQFGLLALFACGLGLAISSAYWLAQTQRKA